MIAVFFFCFLGVFFHSKVVDFAWDVESGQTNPRCLNHWRWTKIWQAITGWSGFGGCGYVGSVRMTTARERYVVMWWLWMAARLVAVFTRLCKAIVMCDFCVEACGSMGVIFRDWLTTQYSLIFRFILHPTATNDHHHTTHRQPTTYPTEWGQCHPRQCPASSGVDMPHQPTMLQLNQVAEWGNVHTASSSSTWGFSYHSLEISTWWGRLVGNHLSTPWNSTSLSRPRRHRFLSLYLWHRGPCYLWTTISWADCYQS